MPAYLPTSDFSSYLPDPGGVTEDELRRQQEAELIRQQQASLAEHAAYAQQLAAASQAVEAKQGDLDLTNRLLQATDPNMDKSARKWLLAQISQRVGIDPNGQSSKQVQQMLLGLQPDTSEQLRRLLVEQTKSAAPGQVNEVIKNILSGQVSGEALVTGLRRGAAQTGEYDATQAPGTTGSRVATPLPGAAGAASAPAGMMKLGGPTGAAGGDTLAGGGGTAELVGAGEDTLGDLSIGARGKTTEQPRETTASEGLQRALGLPQGEASGFPYAQRGITAFTRPTAEQDKLGDQIVSEQQGIRKSLRGVLDIEEVLARNPSAASMAGSLARFAGSAASAWNGALSMLGIEPNADRSKKAVDYINGKSDGSDLSGRERLAADAARIAVLQNQVFRDVIAGSGGMQSKETLGRLTERDADILREGIFSGDPGQLKIGLQSIVGKMINDHQDRVRSTTGYTDYGLNLEGASSDDMQRFLRGAKSGSQVLPDNFTNDVLPKNMDKVKETHEADRAAGSRTGAPTKEGQGPEDPYSPEKKRAAKAELEARMKAIEDENRFYRAQAEGRAQRTEERHDRAEERQRRKDIQEVFSTLGAQIARSFGGSIHFPTINLGGEQDPSAFVYRPTQKRTPPRIPGRGRSRSED